ncbi:MAG TPA: hypothetical protein DDX72_08085 [Ruminococcaceae bacterium]|nr:hypothetical protein [Oscillospiraceae bacterium]
MNSDKKLTARRLLIFLAVAFVPFYIIIPVMWAYFGEPIFASENETVMIATSVVGVFGMMIPSFANLITRLVTKEGFGSSYLGLNCKGKMGYYIASVLVPLGYSVLSVLVMWALYMGGMSFSDAFEPLGMQNTGLFLMQLAFSVIVFFPAFGEEWGWRGYMMPKLMELMPKPAAVIAGGVIWGLWHAPLTVAGHNFGVDYPGYPFVGIGLMCVMCTVLNAFLTLITEKTKSVYPAAFCHAVNNNLGFGVLFSGLGTEKAQEKMTEMSGVSTILPYIAILGAVGIASFVLLVRDKDKKEAARQKEAA